jgi:DinB family
MNAGVRFDELIEFTDWERDYWRGWFSDAALATSVGPNGDGRIRTAGELIRHIFIAETHHVERLTRRPLTDPSSIPANSVGELFAFGDRSRRGLKAYVQSEPPDNWDVPRTFEIIPGNIVSVTPRKFVTHILLHEIRHWAQIATLLRLNNLDASAPDFLFGPVMGGVKA